MAGIYNMAPKEAPNSNPMQADELHGRRHIDFGIVGLDELCADAGIYPDRDDGILLLRATADGQIIPHVLRINHLTEGKLEAAMMPIYMELNRFRNQMFLKERK